VKEEGKRKKNQRQSQLSGGEPCTNRKKIGLIHRAQEKRLWKGIREATRGRGNQRGGKAEVRRCFHSLEGGRKLRPRAGKGGVLKREGLRKNIRTQRDIVTQGSRLLKPSEGGTSDQL